MTHRLIYTTDWYQWLFSVPDTFTTPSWTSSVSLAGLRLSATFYNSHCQGIIGYWSTAFAAIVLSEHFLFRSNNFASSTVEDWDNPARLPFGIAAILAFLGAFGVIVPSMSQTEYTGLIAKAGTGDIGVLTGFLTATILYGVLRTLERKLFPKSEPANMTIYSHDLGESYL